MSFASINPTNLELSPVRVTFKGVDLGATLGKVTVNMEGMKADLKADQMGDTVIDRRISGHKFTVMTELAEIQNKDNWKIVFPWMRELISGGNKAMYAESAIGKSDLADAGILVLHPLSKADSDHSGDYTFYKAIGEGKAETVYGPAEQVKLKITWNILPDFSVQPARFMFHGDTGIGLVAPTVGSPVFTGTGNGTITGLTVFPGLTVSENITIKCVTPQSNAGVFSVTGSVSGPLGLATVGVGFSSPVIAFTLNDGTTDFVLNDQFVVPTVGGNYV